MKTLKDVPLSQYTTFQLGGPCPCLIECLGPDELIATVQKLKKVHEPFLLIGGGSNLVISDHGLAPTVIRYLSETPLIERRDQAVLVAASTLLDDLALFCADEGLGGLNYATGIPGTVGGAVVGNAGAWGRQVGDALKSARIIDAEGRVKTVGPEYFGFSYRHSLLKESNEIIIDVEFALTPADRALLARERAEILKKRAEKHPDLTREPCAGSFFRNIEPSSQAQRRQAAGWFLEESGAKNLKAGGAYIFEKHANIIIKGRGACSQDVHDLHLKMMEAVKRKFGLQLVREVRFVGKFEHALQADSQGFW
ncbi:MAG: UDP-N-acetylmuramate dehydrogenase [Candidatus Omnitrophica bacterium]|nr:UDP-N-acetylmuramate dehydrogenase [Candidatus Omnitrophota bacterium]MDE2214147.1 UDP-N-acetylmuramate dehydrogenase [Candidatus Omnitrophota bacterium]MDE2231184.1 UDP-N-acetylmuramate dehydrogenase [Candidatus Omnitrophota bacterium]